MVPQLPLPSSSRAVATPEQKKRTALNEYGSGNIKIHRLRKSLYKKNTVSYCLYIYVDFSLLRMSLSRLPPPPQKLFHFNRRCAQCWMECKTNFPIFMFWVVADYIYNLQVTLDFQVCRRPTKKNHSNVVKFIGEMRNELKRLKNQFFDFSIFIFWVQVDFVLKFHRKIDKFFVQ